MSRGLHNILSELNTKLEDKIDGLTTYFLAELYEIDGKTRPVTKNKNYEGKYLSPDDGKELQIYYRLIDKEVIEDSEIGKGVQPYRDQLYIVRLIGIGRLDKSKNYHDNVEFEEKVHNAIPNVLADGTLVKPTEENIKKQEIFENEFNGYKWENYYIRFVGFSIDIEIKQKYCDKDVSDVICFQDLVAISDNTKLYT